MKLVLVNRVVHDKVVPDITLDGVEIVTIDLKKGILTVEHRHKEFGPQRGEFELASWANHLPNMQFTV